MFYVDQHFLKENADQEPKPFQYGKHLGNEAIRHAALIVALAATKEADATRAVKATTSTNKHYNTVYAEALELIARALRNHRDAVLRIGMISHDSTPQVTVAPGSAPQTDDRPTK